MVRTNNLLINIIFLQTGLAKKDEQGQIVRDIINRRQHYIIAYSKGHTAPIFYYYYFFPGALHMEGGSYKLWKELI